MSKNSTEIMCYTIFISLTLTKTLIFVLTTLKKVHRKPSKMFQIKRKEKNPHHLFGVNVLLDKMVADKDM